MTTQFNVPSELLDSFTDVLVENELQNKIESKDEEGNYEIIVEFSRDETDILEELMCIIEDDECEVIEEELEE